jgi:hypothetical protein
MKLIETLKSILGRADAGSADLRAALTSIDIAPFEDAVRVAEKTRAGLLLDGTEAALDKADEVLKIAIRERDRAVAARDELSKRLAEAKVREVREALDAERAAVEKEAQAVAKLLSEKWTPMQREMIAILKRLDKAEGAVSKVNALLLAADRHDTLPPVEERVFPVHPSLYAPIYSIREQTAFRSLPDASGWPVENLTNEIAKVGAA